MKPKNEKTPKYYLNGDNEFVIENYNYAKPFANFFPGIAGKYGIPIWAFYVNRAQCISSFGTKDKDHAILEFSPANKSWQTVSSHGFRTFLKITDAQKIAFYEPFHNGFSNLKFQIDNSMSLSAGTLRLEEENTTLGIKSTVEYFTIPQDNFGALARILTIKNTGRKTKSIQLLDGLPQITPFGTNNFFLKEMSRTIEAWMTVENLENNAPFFKLAVDPTDRPEVVHISEGNFYIGFSHNAGKTQLTKPIVDPKNIFGSNTDFSYPQRFMQSSGFSIPKAELKRCITPSAFSYISIKLAPGEEKKLYSVIGYMRSSKTLNASIAKITKPGYIEKKKKENKMLLNELTRAVETKSSSREFDLYTKQTYLDNVLRGGIPEVFDCKDSKSAFYLYSRKHGDTERDYNRFLIQPTYYSQGNGNYRDVNQNRRSDIWFNPLVNSENIKTFFNLLQTDGFNPLVVKGLTFTLTDKNTLETKINSIASPKHTKIILGLLEKPFTPGDLILFIEDNKINLGCSHEDFLKLVLSCCAKIQEAEHSEGFWIDHWHYNLDLIESYLNFYPEQLNQLIFKDKSFTFFDNIEIVKPRRQKYVLRAGQPKQLHSVGADHAKKELIKTRTQYPHVGRTNYGTGEVYYTNLINKLICLFVNKLASLDPFGCGIEMESDKPNWYDALNGLPALFGSSLCETFELKRLAIFIKESIEKTKTDSININAETAEFMRKLNAAIETALDSQSEQRDFMLWDSASSLKEHFRHVTTLGVSGEEIRVDCEDIITILNNALKQIDYGIAKAKVAGKNLYYSYFINEVASYDNLDSCFIRPTKFLQKKVPLFLEGQVHALRLANKQNEAAEIYAATKNSPLYDRKLKMYKVTDSLKNMPEEIGRCRVFTPGWLENESIWLHMEYKYLLEILKQSLYKEFFSEFKNCLIPFQNPKRYGRSILENSSFLVSSAFPDKKLHGNGFVARLSGSTAEFIQIWLIMNIGKQPFFTNNDNELNMKFSPALAGWLFDKAGNYSFNFLNSISITYHNPAKKDTFGKNAAQITKIILWNKDKPTQINSSVIPSPYAERIRSRQFDKIDIYLK